MTGARRHAAVARRLCEEVWNEHRYDVADQLLRTGWASCSNGGMVELHEP